MKIRSYERYIDGFLVLEKYSEEYFYQLEHLKSVIDKSMQDGFSILDIGAGTGEFAKSVLNSINIKPFAYTAIEPSKDNFIKLNENLYNFDLDKKLLNEKFKPETSINNKFDLIIMLHCFYWFANDAERYLQKVLSLKKDNGKIVIYIASPDCLVYLMCCCFESLLPKGRMPERFCSLELRQLLNRLNRKSEISYFPGKMKTDNLFNSKDKSELWKFIEFSLGVEALSMEGELLKTVEDFIKHSAYKDADGELKINLGVDAVVI